MRTVATFLLLLLMLAPVPSPMTVAWVSKVIDGDTIVLADGTTVRYIGVDAPECHYGRHKEMLSDEATIFNTRLVTGKPILLEFDVGRRDSYNRLLAYVFADGRLVNSELIRWGYAKASPHAPNYRYHALLEAMEAIARKHNRGLWARDNLMER